MKSREQLSKLAEAEDSPRQKGKLLFNILSLQSHICHQACKEAHLGSQGNLHFNYKSWASNIHRHNWIIITTLQQQQWQSPPSLGSLMISREIDLPGAVGRYQSEISFGRAFLMRLKWISVAVEEIMIVFCSYILMLCFCVVNSFISFRFGGAFDCCVWG